MQSVTAFALLFLRMWLEPVCGQEKLWSAWLLNSYSNGSRDLCDRGIKGKIR